MTCENCPSKDFCSVRKISVSEASELFERVIADPFLTESEREEINAYLEKHVDLKGVFKK